MSWLDRDDEDDKPHTTSLRMWSTADPKPRGGNARMWSTSDRTGGTLRAWTTEKSKPVPTADDYDTFQRGADDAENVRTGNWTAPWKDAPLPGTPQEARQRAKANRRANRFRPGTSRITDQVARRRGGFQSTGGKARGGFKALTARENGRRGGRPRKLTTASSTAPTTSTATDQVRNRGRFTSATARQAGARGGSVSTPAKARAAQVNARRPRRRRVAPPLG